MGHYTARMKPVREIARRMEGRMGWTTEKPTKPGWYWYRERSDIPYRPVQIILANYTGAIELWVVQDTENRPLECVAIEGGEWQGPITPEE